ncbi:DUF3223 domain-containing protein [Candidatus Poribacteria bacterium]|nr:DUF3223 domain-containing protein [Candidatus Poribacteria bacterium]
MSRAIPIIIGAEPFASREAAKTRIRTLIAPYRFGECLNEIDTAFCLELFKHHTGYLEKIGCGVQAIQVRRDEQGNRYFHLLREDGTDTDISWVHCITPKKEAIVVLEALRSSVKQQIQAAKERFVKLGATCPFRGTRLSFTNSHVDHFNPTFEQLVSEFLQLMSIRLTDIEVMEQEGNDFRGLPADRLLRDAWEEFHRREANLRLISSAANLSDVRRKS